MNDAERYLARWKDAGLLDDRSAGAIRRYEAAQARPAGRQWQVLLALILGAILLGAGVLLFVAAHWDQLSPPARLCLVLAMLAFFHGAALLVRDRFGGLATAMHAVGTVTAGAAIALVGQIFNMHEHWPAAVLLWALCAGAGWLLLRDEFQQTLTLLLVPAWIVSEWSFRTEGFSGADVYLARFGLVLGAAFLTAFLRSHRRVASGILFAVGALLLPTSIAVLSSGWRSAGYLQTWGFLPVSWRFVAASLTVLLVALAAAQAPRSLIPASAALVLAYALPWAQTTVTESALGQPWKHTEPSVLAYLMVAAAAVLLVAWGVRISSRALVNYGTVAFAATVMWFYFSSVMDKLGRSLGLILLGILFLGGGWLLERTRRRLVTGMTGVAA